MTLEEIRYIKFDASKEEFFSKIAENIYQMYGGNIEGICDNIVKLFDGLASSQTIRGAIPSHFKNSLMASIRLGKTNVAYKIKSELVQLIQDRKNNGETWYEIFMYITNLEKKGGIRIKLTWSSPNTMRKWFARNIKILEEIENKKITKTPV